MAGHRIFVTWPMEREARAILERVGTVETNATENELPADALARAVQHADAVIPMGAHPVGKDVMAAGQRLRVIAVAAVGYNLIDIAAATERGILVTNTPGVLTET